MCWCVTIIEGDRWLPGVIQRKTGPVSYRVKLADGSERHYHQDQVRTRTVAVELPIVDTDQEIDTSGVIHSGRDTGNYG